MIGPVLLEEKYGGKNPFLYRPISYRSLKHDDWNYWRKSIHAVDGSEIRRLPVAVDAVHIHTIYKVLLHPRCLFGISESLNGIIEGTNSICFVYAWDFFLANRSSRDFTKIPSILQPQEFPVLTPLVVIVRWMNMNIQPAPVVQGV